MNEWHIGTVAAGVFFVITGVGFLLDALDLIHLRPAVVFPVAVIAIGLVIILGGSGSRTRAGSGGETEGL